MLLLTLGKHPPTSVWHLWPYHPVSFLPPYSQVTGTKLFLVLGVDDIRPIIPETSSLILSLGGFQLSPQMFPEAPSQMQNQLVPQHFCSFKHLAFLPLFLHSVRLTAMMLSSARIRNVFALFTDENPKPTGHKPIS
jgi:hypothetical protein